MPVSVEDKFEISRREELAPPTKIDIIETKNLLRDFRIKADIPSFDTMKALLNWRVSLIRGKVSTF